MLIFFLKKGHKCAYVMFVGTITNQETGNKGKREVELRYSTRYALRIKRCLNVPSTSNSFASYKKNLSKMDIFL